MYQHGLCRAHLASTAPRPAARYALKRQSIRFTRNPRPLNVRPANKAQHGTPDRNSVRAHWLLDCPEARDSRPPSPTPKCGPTHAA
eukprot:3682135-Prymnesium_polylepis.1